MVRLKVFLGAVLSTFLHCGNWTSCIQSTIMQTKSAEQRMQDSIQQNYCQSKSSSCLRGWVAVFKLLLRIGNKTQHLGWAFFFFFLNLKLCFWPADESKSFRSVFITTDPEINIFLCLQAGSVQLVFKTFCAFFFFFLQKSKQMRAVTKCVGKKNKTMSWKTLKCPRDLSWTADLDANYLSS